MLTLNKILEAIGFPLVYKDINIKRICEDSRKVEEGDLFVALAHKDLQKHVKEACQKGASAILSPKPFALQVPVIVHPNLRFVLSKLAKMVYPNQPKTLVAVTGTNGKSSVVDFVQQFWWCLGLKAASFGTLGIKLPKSLQNVSFDYPSLTTPTPLVIHRLLHQLKELGITHCAFEASSHGLDQYRLHSVSLKAAGFTNLTQDHLDYHESMALYFQAKEKLFKEILSSEGTAVLNWMSPYFERLMSGAKNSISYGIEVGTKKVGADLKAVNICYQGQGIQFDLGGFGKTYPNLFVNVTGLFQIENILCAMGLVLSEGYQLDSLLPFLEHLKGITGRLEYIGSSHKGGHIYVDYAHTPDALERCLKSLRSYTKGRLIVVFGCGGNRDATKRPLMGSIAYRFADEVIITDDNPRFEAPHLIRKQILKGCPIALEIADRSKAIEEGILKLEKEDILLIAGKGHETGQIIRDKIIPFDDRKEVLKLLTTFQCDKETKCGPLKN
ncbi:MAG: UDP-N-acetylmuramoyl-L-alanyl-D-glutamate--2,6-diaminopimelate ligase [Proteobacteria bacterium]|nr:UDP-N-acetylmuramoyl-L-alanyl-D-glutamate--2,6-diaminopimelate ligase [Pseudomonadota bacterium]